MLSGATFDCLMSPSTLPTLEPRPSLGMPSSTPNASPPPNRGSLERPPEPHHLSIETNVYVGLQASARLPAWLAAYGFMHPSAIIDEAVAALPSMDARLHGWEEQGLHVVKVYRSRSMKEPDYDYLDEVTNEFRGLKTDVVIGIGGGSALDLAKGVGLLLRNPGHGVAYRGINKILHPGIPVVLLPTTAGSGSEVTATASFIDRKTNSKLGINGRYVGCLFSVLDPALLTSCPASVTIGSGLDALVHAVEAVTATSANSVSILFGIEATRLLLASLPTAVAEPDNVEARAATLLGSHYAGMAMRNAGGGPASGISYPLGSCYEVPHGFAGGLLLPHIVTFNVRQGYIAGYARIYERLDGVTAHRLDDQGKAAAFRDALWNLYQRLGTPRTLSRWGVGREAVLLLADLTLAQRKTNLDLNPAPFCREDVVTLLTSVTGSAG